MGVYEVNAIPAVQVTNTRMDQWGFQGIIIMWEILVMFFLRELLRDLANLNGVPLLQGSLVTMGIITFLREPLRDLGKSQQSSFILGVYDGITARFGKISMEFLHLGVYNGMKQLSQRCR